MPARPSFAARLKAWSRATSTAAILLQNSVVALVYIPLAVLALVPSLASEGRATPIWPADGWALVAAWWLGPRVLPGVAVASALVVAWRSPFPVAAAASLAPVVGVLLAVTVLRRVRFDERLERVRDPLLLTLVAAPLGAAVSASIGTTMAWLFGVLNTPELPSGWRMWLMREWLGIIVLAPLLFTWLRARALPFALLRRMEGVAAVAGMAIVAVFAVRLWTNEATADVPLAFLGLGFVVWAGLRFGARGVSAVLLLVALMATGAAVAGLGPLRALPMEAAQSVTFTFLVLSTVLGQVVAATKAERDDAVARRAELEEQLGQAQKMEAVGRLAGSVTHDFNNLLTAIVGYTDGLITDLDAGDSRRADAEQIERAALRAMDLTRQMLSSSRTRSDQPSRADVNAALVRAEPMLQRLLGDDVRVTISAHARHPVVPIAPWQVEQLLLNLALNARDAMPKGGRLAIESSDAAVTEDDVEVDPELKPGEFVEIRVSDTGTGIPLSVLPRIFEPFFTTKSPGKGTGLGLSTVHGIVRQGGGFVTVDTDNTSGTTFRINLPRAAGEAVPDGDSSSRSLPGGTEYVLLVDDDATVRHMMRDLLTRLGYSITEAASGRAAIALGREDSRHFDLVICDVLLGDLSGTAVAEAIRALRPSARVLFISGYADDAIVRTGVLEGGRPFLQKPFSPVQLARKIREVLENRESDAA